MAVVISVVLRVPWLREQPVVGGCCGAVATATLVYEALMGVAGVQRVIVDEDTAQVEVHLDRDVTDPKELSAALSAIGVAWQLELAGEKL